MTIVLSKPTVAKTVSWTSMPGWDIVVDLTPPELRARRSLATLRRMLAVWLTLVALLCAGGYVLAARANSDAQSELTAATETTTVVEAAIGRHSVVTQVQAATAGINAQLATLFAGDVDLPGLVTELTSAGRGAVSITSLSVTIDPTTSSANPETGAATIGTVTMTGTAGNLAGLANEVTALARVRGVTDVIPTNNTASKNGATWTLTLQLTSDVYSGRYSSATATAGSSTDSATTSSATSPTGGN